MADYYTIGADGLLLVNRNGQELPGMSPDMAPELEAAGIPLLANQGSGGAGGAPGMGGGGFTPIGQAPEVTDLPPSLATEQDAGSMGSGGTSGMGEGGSSVSGSNMPSSATPMPPPAPTAEPGRPLPQAVELGGGMPEGGAPEPPRRAAPAKWVDTQLSPLRTTQRQVEYSPYQELTGEEIDERLAPIEERERILTDQFKRDALRRAEADLARDEQYFQRRRLMEQEQQRQAELNKRTRMFEKERDIHREQIQGMSVDPRRYFKSMPIWAKALAILAAGAQQGLMARFGQTGPNPMLQQLNELNQQDIESQRFDYENALKRGDDLDNRYRDALKMWGDPDAAEMQMEKDKLDLYDAYMAREAESRAQGDQARVAFETARNELAERRMQLEEELNVRAQNKVIDSMQATPKQLVGGGGGAATNKLRARAVRLPDGRIMFATDDASGKSANKFMFASSKAAKLAQEIIDLRKQSSAWERASGTGLGAELEAKVNELRLVQKERYELGALTESDIALTAVPNAHEVFEAGAEEKLRSIASGAIKDAQDYAQQNLSEDPEGTVIPAGSGVRGERR